jgi:hypothetical protein
MVARTAPDLMRHQTAADITCWTGTGYSFRRYVALLSRLSRTRLDARSEAERPLKTSDFDRALASASGAVLVYLLDFIDILHTKINLSTMIIFKLSTMIIFKLSVAQK